MKSENILRELRNALYVYDMVDSKLTRNGERPTLIFFDHPFGGVCYFVQK